MFIIYIRLLLTSVFGEFFNNTKFRKYSLMSNVINSNALITQFFIKTYVLKKFPGGTR